MFFSLFLTFLVKGFSRVVFSLALFNFQDAVQPPFSSGDLIIISHFIRLVKYFSEFFSKKFFKTFYVTVTALCGNFYIISHIFRFVKYFFQIFSGNFLQTFFPKSKKHFLINSSFFLAAPSDSFIIISCYFSIVKQKKFLFFRCFL